MELQSCPPHGSSQLHTVSARTGQSEESLICLILCQRMNAKLIQRNLKTSYYVKSDFYCVLLLWRFIRRTIIKTPSFVLVDLRPLGRLSDPRQWSAHLGMLTQGSAKYVAEIQRIIVHEYYNAYTFDYDIALLQLKKPWPSSLSPLVQPICLPPTSHTVMESHHCWVTGWGYKSEEGEQNVKYLSGKIYL